MDFYGLVHGSPFSGAAPYADAYGEFGEESWEKGYVDGFARAMREVECFFACRDDGGDGLLEKLRAEYDADVEGDLLRWLEGTRCEAIVSLSDELACGEGANGDA